ncbi:DNA polymerase III, alpha subunit [Campylobacter ureolyticus RIGS 9880]|uniref:DNA polymerase III subunit alpha n=1 Tax=Campylobacter ureolyticus RIGS 9880 TaxID=1032069 RepID=A0AAU8U4X1_9BACT|nr:DNA polymerase III subunit alpha [Campylobacter ureolyticus]AKT91171.1 DNA polymerase III, alpha subunit [Campylobacter ureolyticus RIGS 9880]
MSKFTHLHLHTEYSLLDGANKIPELASILKEQGVNSVAITDHGNMFGAIDFYKTMKKNGIKPIIGIEAYIHNHDDLGDKSDRQRFHLILLAKNEIGYKNLMYLSSMAFLEGFYYNPRINKKILKEHSEGLICSAACLQGEVNFHLNMSQTNIQRGAKGYERAKEVALEYKEIFKDDFYLEIMRHGITDQLNIDKQILQISKETGIKVIATNDAHYPYQNMSEAHNIYMAISGMKLRHAVRQFYVKSSQEMEKIFADIPNVIENTQEIVDKCNLELDLGHPTPPNFKFTTDYAKNLNLTLPNPGVRDDLENDKVLFEYLSRKGLEERLKFIDPSKHKSYKDRLEREISIINSMKFPGYMLIVSDFINHAKEKGIPVGPGRGSAAGSLVAFSLKITDIDPLPYNLLFERFLNPERVSMPDIDVDFCQDRRGEVIDYVIEQYGRYNVAQVATFGKLLAKGVIRDVARVCNMPYAEADKMAKLIPNELKITLRDSFDKEPKIKSLLEENIEAKKIWDYALELEGLNRNAGMHAAGVVISNDELWNKTPVFIQTNNDKGHLITQYTKDYLEDVDLIKFDFLGLKTLTVINNAIKLVKMRYNKDVIWEKIDINDKKVYETISSGNTLGIFQIESGGMQKLATDLKPDNFEDVIAMIALFRPGPMDLIPNFIERKHGNAKIDYLIDDIKEILEPTYGIIVYQEQVMQIVQKIGGFSLGEADIVRRAMSKKKEEEMKRLKKEYLEGAKKGGYDIKKADELFEMIMKFASYGFNKSHAAAYALITFQTAYLKAYYPAEFMAALLTSEENNLDKVARYIDEIKRLNIEILPPSINLSLREFSVVQKGEKDAIVFGMGAIKGVGLGAIENIVEERKNGDFTDISNFASRIDSFKVNKRALDGLIKSGAMDCLKLTRKNLFLNIDNITESTRNANKIKSDKENSLFADLSDDDMSMEVEVRLELTNGEYTQKDILKNEKEVLGLYLSGHPLDDYVDEINEIDYTLTSQFEELNDVTETLLVGKIEEINTRITKKGSKMAIVNVLDLHGNFEMVVFDNKLPEIEALSEAELERPYAFRVRIEKDDAQYKITLNEFLRLDEAKNSDFKKRSFAKKGFKKEEKRVYEEYVYTINLDELNQNIINEIYNLAYKQNNLKNSKKLILRVETSTKVYIFETNFFVDENFGQNANEILVA